MITLIPKSSHESRREDGERHIVFISDHYSSLDGLHSLCRSVVVPNFPARFTGLDLRDAIGAPQHLTALYCTWPFSRIQSMEVNARNVWGAANKVKRERLKLWPSWFHTVLGNILAA